MTQKRTLWLVRHGETQFNVEGKLQGMSDSPLTEAGLQQIGKLAERLSENTLDLIFCSDLLRAKTTAEIVASRHNDLKPIILSELRERSFGIYEGTSFNRYRDEIGDKHFQPDYVVQDGESLLMARQRAQKALSIILSHQFDQALVVAHGSFNRCFMAAACNSPDLEWVRYQQGNCCVNQLTEDGNGYFRIDVLNCCNHLDIR